MQESYTLQWLHVMLCITLLVLRQLYFKGAPVNSAYNCIHLVMELVHVVHDFKIYEKQNFKKH